MPNKTNRAVKWEEEIFNSSGYYLDDKERVRLDIDQKELEKIIRQTIKQEREEAVDEYKKQAYKDFMDWWNNGTSLVEDFIKEYFK